MRCVEEDGCAHEGYFIIVQGLGGVCLGYKTDRKGEVDKEILYGLPDGQEGRV